jgi:mycofactocin system creatininase family protein
VVVTAHTLAFTRLMAQAAVQPCRRSSGVRQALADLTWPDAEDRAAGGVLAVPVGATEQHGPHLPLCTDTEIAVAIVTGLARERPIVVAAPPLAYGSSGEHADFAGTLSIGQAALELMLVELCRSACGTFTRVLLVSTHGGNAQPVQRAVSRLRGERRDVRAWGPKWPGDAHAGRTETSIMLALAPGQVRPDEARAGQRAPIAELLPQLRANGVRAVSDTGVLGDPTGAHAQEGHELLHAATRDLAAMLDTWLATPGHGGQG